MPGLVLVLAPALELELEHPTGPIGPVLEPGIGTSPGSGPVPDSGPVIAFAFAPAAGFAKNEKMQPWLVLGPAKRPVMAPETWSMPVADLTTSTAGRLCSRLVDQQLPLTILIGSVNPVADRREGSLPHAVHLHGVYP